MGTRNLTVVIKDGNIKLSQYCQWDGHFRNAGLDFLNFVRTNLIDRYHGTGRVLKSTYNLNDFKEVVDKLVGVDEAYLNKIEEVRKQFDDSNEISIPYEIMFPQFHRNTGVRLLQILMDNKHEIGCSKGFPVELSTQFLLYVEYINVLNLDKDELYMLTCRDFNGKKLDTCNIVKTQYEAKGFNCYYKSKIKDLKNLKSISKYVESIGLD